MKDYYAILGVRRNASSAEIKSSFRRLANLYHPDRNPSIEAEAIIKEVIEAYQVLEDPIQRSLYDGLLRKDAPPPAPLTRSGRPHRDPRYRAKKPDPNYRSEKQQVVELMKEWLPAALMISRATLIACVIISFDYTLTPKKETEVIQVRRLSGFHLGADNRITTEHGNEFVVGQAAANKLMRGTSITISYSPWFKVPLYLTRGESPEVFRIPATIYGNFIFLPVVLMLTSLFGVFWRTGIGFRFNCGVVNAILLFLTVIFFMIHHIKVP